MFNSDLKCNIQQKCGEIFYRYSLKNRRYSVCIYRNAQLVLIWNSDMPCLFHTLDKVRANLRKWFICLLHIGHFIPFIFWVVFFAILWMINMFKNILVKLHRLSSQDHPWMYCWQINRLQTFYDFLYPCSNSILWSKSDAIRPLTAPLSPRVALIVIPMKFCPVTRPFLKKWQLLLSSILRINQAIPYNFNFKLYCKDIFGVEIWNNAQRHGV